MAQLLRCLDHQCYIVITADLLDYEEMEHPFLSDALWYLSVCPV